MVCSATRTHGRAAANADVRPHSDSDARQCTRTRVTSQNKKLQRAHWFTVPNTRTQMPRAKKSDGETADRMPRMTPAERTYMIDWMGMGRPGGGREMENWRWLYGGAAKGQNMNGDASDVHASSGYLALAEYVNSKAKIKSGEKAWTVETAEKRWTTMKTAYRKAMFLPVPIAENNEDFEDEMKMLGANREIICKDFNRLFLLLQDHPSTQPQHTIDSMSSSKKKLAAVSDDDEGCQGDDDAAADNDDDDDDDDAVKSALSADVTASKSSKSSAGDKRSIGGDGKSPSKKEKKEKEKKLSKQQEAASKKTEFHLKKPTSDPSSKRADIQTLFIKSQEELAKNAKVQMKSNAILELIKAGITDAATIKSYMAIMFGENCEGEQTGPVTDKMTIDNSNSGEPNIVILLDAVKH